MLSPELELWITWENITLGKFNLEKPKLNPELEPLTKFNLEVFYSSQVVFKQILIEWTVLVTRAGTLTYLHFGSLSLSPILKLSTN